MKNLRIVSLPLFCLLCFYWMSPPLFAQGLSSTWNNVPIGGGGRTVGMIGSPTSDMLYLRTDVAGMYKRSASDTEWTRLTETFTPDYGERMSGCAGLGVHPTNDNILYAALSKGIYKSTDQGRTWSQVLVVDVLTNGSLNDREDRNYGEALVVDQRNGNVVYYGSHRDGLFYTRNGGTSWTQIPSDQLPYDGSRSVVVDNLRKTENGRAKFVYVSVKNKGIYRSSNGGTTFAPWQTTLPGGGTYVRWLRQSQQGDLYAAHDKGLARWDGSVWEDVSPIVGVDVLAVATDPKDNDQLLCFAYQRPANVGNIYRSKDRGDSWQIAPYTAHNLPPWADNRYEPGQQITFALYFDDQSEGANNTAYVMSNYAPWKTTNIWASTVAWDAFIEGDEMTINITGVSLPPGGAPYIAGMADIRGFKIDDVTAYPEKRLNIAQADVNNGFFAPNMTGIDYCESDPNQVWFVAVKRVAASAQDEPTEHIAQVYRSADGGDNLGYITNPAASTEWAKDAGGPKIAVSATNADKAVMMARNLVRYTTDGGVTWRNSGSVNRTTGLLERNIEYEFDQLIKSDRVNGNKFYLYATDGRFFKSTNAGASFGLVSNAGLPARIWNRGGDSSTGGGVHIAVAPGREEEVWLALGAAGIWRASGNGTNKTSSFAEVTYFARDNPTAVTFGKAAPGSSTPAVYVFGKRQSDGQWGVWKSDDLGGSWQLATPEDEPGQWPRLLVGDMQTYGRVYMGNASYGIQYLTIDATSSPTPLPTTDQWYYLRSVAHNKYLQGTGTDDGTGNDCSGSAAQDVRGVTTGNTGSWTQWKFIDVGDGQYYVENKSHQMHLQVYGQPDATANDGSCGDDGTKIVRMSDTGCGNDWTRWELREAPGGNYYLYNGKTDTYLQCLSGAGNVAVRQAPTSCSGSWLQWELVAVGGNARTETEIAKQPITLEKTELAIGVYPNPATEVLQLQKNATDEVEDLVLIDLLGRKLVPSTMQGDENEVRISIGGLRPGVYLLQGTLNQQRFIRRVIIE
jgi:hypothetical protein